MGFRIPLHFPSKYATAFLTVYKLASEHLQTTRIFCRKSSSFHTDTHHKNLAEKSYLWHKVFLLGSNQHPPSVTESASSLVQPQLHLTFPKLCKASKIVQESSVKSDPGILIVITPEQASAVLLDST